MDKTAQLEALVTHFANGNKAKFAGRLGVKPQTISTWMNRNTFDVYLVYAKCDGVSADWLLTGEGSMMRDSTPIPPEPAEHHTEKCDVACVEQMREEIAQLNRDKMQLLEEVVHLQKQLIDKLR